MQQNTRKNKIEVKSLSSNYYMYEKLIIFPALVTLKIFNRQEKHVYNQISCYHFLLQNTIKRAITKKLFLYIYYVPNGYYPGKSFHISI